MQGKETRNGGGDVGGNGHETAVTMTMFCFFLFLCETLENVCVGFLTLGCQTLAAFQCIKRLYQPYMLRARVRRLYQPFVFCCFALFVCASSWISRRTGLKRPDSFVWVNTPNMSSLMHHPLHFFLSSV